MTRSENDSRVRRVLARFGLGQLAAQTIAVFGWNVARLTTQLVWVVLLARFLGAEGYGSFSGIAGLALAFSGLAGLGLGLRMYQDTARDPAMFGLRWRQALRVLGWSGIGLSLLFLATGWLLFPNLPWLLLMAVAAAELLMAPFITHAAFAYASRRQVAQAAAAPVVLSIARVIAAGIATALPVENGLQMYALLHLAATAVAAGLVLRRCQLRLMPPPAEAVVSRNDLVTGLGFSSVWASGLALGSIDKAVALRVGGAGLAGEYTAAHRFANLVALPVEALVTAVMPRLFSAGGGSRFPVRMVGTLALTVASYGMIAGVILWYGADLVPLLLGEVFRESVAALHLLAFWVPAYCLRSLGSNVLLGFGWKRWRFWSELAAMMAVLMLMILWIPAYGVAGAAAALVVAEGMLVTIVWGRILVAGRRTLEAIP
ncbi:lipopolysaccharide biosynthesis protein [Luteimonas suaedae]|uniref:lipopolysaccharide biosynthesis protein n=1 Tax=Luteimonas suaedae TaxID=2605430 RepID=UPI001658FEA0|nr:oligosaccharide flippase family protein [Luteimonas suaedae]